ncbi:nuclear transport factor 2 family protein [Virgibacillus flavescens]|uniref:nuclear transport factor 2 family protein n=1 Tax=Virgibacillus flavescens TaxID=1611422 RepID=UPI003D33F36F
MSQLNEFIRKFNEAFTTADVDFILESVTDDIRWEMMGEPVINGKAEVKKELEMIKDANKPELTITKTITHGRTAAIEGTMKMKDKNGVEKTYAFCDTYVLNKFKDGKIKELNSYLIELKQ